jgi:hypothetical protein
VFLARHADVVGDESWPVVAETIQSMSSEGSRTGSLREPIPHWQAPRDLTHPGVSEDLVV